MKQKNKNKLKVKKLMRLFYEEYAYDERWQQFVAKLS